MKGALQWGLTVLIASGSLMLPATSAGAGEFKSFSEESQRVSQAIGCPKPKVTPADSFSGALYGCIMGKAETAKFWINEEPGKPGVVQNIKVMWNDWFKDLGYGIHADRKQAEAMVNAMADLYVPKLKNELLKAFAGSTGKRWTSELYEVEFRYTRGPAIDERLLILKAR